MAIPLNDSIRVQGSKPVEDKRLNNGVPYTTVAQANSLIIKTDRYPSLEVYIGTVNNYKTYWWKNGVENTDLVERLEGAVIPGVEAPIYINGSNQISINPASSTSRGTMSSAHYMKLEEINLSDYATLVDLSNELSNKYSITSTNIPSPDSTYQWIILTDGSGVTRRMNFATYMSSNYASISSMTPQIKITTSTNITTNTTDSNSLGMNGRNVLIANGTNNINIQCEPGSVLLTTIMKLGTGTITFTTGTGVTLVELDLTRVLTGGIGSQATLSSDGNTYYLTVNNR